MKRKRYWIYNPPKKSSFLTQEEKELVKSPCDKFIAEKLKPKLLSNFYTENQNRVMEDIYCKWYRNFLHIQESGLTFHMDLVFPLKTALKIFSIYRTSSHSNKYDWCKVPLTYHLLLSSNATVSV